MQEEKITNLKTFQTKLEVLKILMTRNRILKPEKKVQFPFFIIEPSNFSLQETTLDIKMQADLLRMKLLSNNPMKIYGDIEATSEIPAITSHRQISPRLLSQADSFGSN